MLHKTTDIDVKWIILYVDNASNIYDHTVCVCRGSLPRALNQPRDKLSLKVEVTLTAISWNRTNTLKLLESVGQILETVFSFQTLHSLPLPQQACNIM